MQSLLRCRDLYRGKNPSEEEIFLYTEAMNYLIEEEKNPQHMMCLGGYYYEIKRFDLALKYYEMAAAMNYDCAYECLGYIWYYGRTGEKDYKECFEKYDITHIAVQSSSNLSHKLEEDENWKIIYSDLFWNLYENVQKEALD